jgi:hypothetical protein
VFSRTIGLVAIAGFLAAAGCAEIQKTNDVQEERMLAAAGFQIKLADTPERMKKAEALPQRKFTRVPYGDGTVRYVWADAKYCKCIYAGTEAAYGRYWKLAMDSAIATDEAQAAVASDLYGDSGAWGPWGPWW